MSPPWHCSSNLNSHRGHNRQNLSLDFFLWNPSLEYTCYSFFLDRVHTWKYLLARTWNWSPDSVPQACWSLEKIWVKWQCLQLVAISITWCRVENQKPIVWWQVECMPDSSILWIILPEFRTPVMLCNPLHDIGYALTVWQVFASEQKRKFH